MYEHEFCVWNSVWIDFVLVEWPHNVVFYWNITHIIFIQVVLVFIIIFFHRIYMNSIKT